ncbi:type VI secretion system baseplate subunit TssE [Granulicella tundricola]|uniref:Type VI secretion system lysozyme-related protein n=1 Tax=Granulicella tundricola (strain ATCC BAA-1859 / DSM 23138 / MP5ACTX9) TaxID=1198114 RepID=E8X5R2_GRATM|nr:type VI secretion system baseplate subunit TssE [Granulicella tundricola]ADW70796.1 type VI secretion system lysozyme-related protein [Granulicella tundricola MP5ACTX9]
MAKSKAENLVTQSLLDRLCDVDDWPTTRQQSMRVYRESIKRDVEYLLNSRRPPIEDINLYPRAAASVINYGLPDIHSYSESAGDQSALMTAMLQTLRRFEPRIQGVRVFVSRGEAMTRSLQFRIEGRIQFDTQVENIEFDTVLELTRGEYEVK